MFETATLRQWELKYEQETSVRRVWETVSMGYAVLFSRNSPTTRAGGIWLEFSTVADWRSECFEGSRGKGS